MDPVQPFLLLRARPEPEDAEEFRAWLHRVHLPDARKIPGFSTIEAGQTPAGTFLVFYSFESTDAVQKALNSPQAAYARGALENWASRLEELLIEMFSPLGPLPIYQSIN